MHEDLYSYTALDTLQRLCSGPNQLDDDTIVHVMLALYGDRVDWEAMLYQYREQIDAILSEIEQEEIEDEYGYGLDGRRHHCPDSDDVEDPDLYSSEEFIGPVIEINIGPVHIYF